VKLHLKAPRMFGAGLLAYKNPETNQMTIDREMDN
jgi:hypothetical protein